MEALFATISYRLEPDGWASRFPMLLDRLHEGRLDATSADQALAELDLVSAELRRLPVDRVVWSMHDLKKRDDAGEPVRRGAANAFEYFVAQDGRPILTCIAEMVQKSKQSGDATSLGSLVRHRNLVSGIVLLVLGLAVAFGGYLYFPNTILVAEHVPEYVVQHGPLVWPLGGVIAIVGAFALSGAVYPSFAATMRRHRTAFMASGIFAMLVVMYFGWR